MIELQIQGSLKLREQLRFLRLTPADRRRVHAWLARDLERAMKRAVREKVENSPAELFDSARLRKRKARSFARMVGRRATANAAVLFDKDRSRRGHGRLGPASKDGRATAEQAARLKELGFSLSKVKIRRLPQSVAGRIIRHLEQKQGAGRHRRREREQGSLLLLVWREQGEEIVAQVDPVAVFRRFMRAKLARAA